MAPKLKNEPIWVKIGKEMSKNFSVIGLHVFVLLVFDFWYWYYTYWSSIKNTLNYVRWIYVAQLQNSLFFSSNSLFFSSTFHPKSLTEECPSVLTKRSMRSLRRLQDILLLRQKVTANWMLHPCRCR